jgi:hypothetical protein
MGMITGLRRDDRKNNRPIKADNILDIMETAFFMWDGSKNYGSASCKNLEDFHPGETFTRTFQMLGLLMGTALVGYLNDQGLTLKLITFLNLLFLILIITCNSTPWKYVACDNIGNNCEVEAIFRTHDQCMNYISYTNHISFDWDAIKAAPTSTPVGFKYVSSVPGGNCAK